jgi:hypothetical protein
MRRLITTICVFSIIALIALSLFACKPTDSSSTSEPSFFSDETSEAVLLVKEANEILRGVKKLYKENESKLQELKDAMNAKNVDTVKKLSDDFVYQINDGMTLAEDAFKKIDEASSKNINSKFQEYLSLKKQALRKQLDAFEFRRQLARQLRDAFKITKDAGILEKAKGELQLKEENFRKLMDEAREISLQANDLATTKKSV